MAPTSITILLFGLCLGLTAGRFVLDETEFLAENEGEIMVSENGLIGDPDVDLNKVVLQAILRGEISLEEILEEGLVQDLVPRLKDGPLKDVGWSKCITIDTKIHGVRVNTQICVSIQWLSENIGLRVTLQIGSYTYVKEISVRNPPAICYGIPGVKYLKACIEFYNIDIGNKSGCVRLKISFLSWNLGCFDFLHMEEHLSQHPQAGHLIAKSETVKNHNRVILFQ